MKKKITLIWILFLGIAAIAQQKIKAEYDQIFFDNSIMSGSYYHSSVSYSGNCYVENQSKKLLVDESVYFTAKNSLRLNYVSSKGSWSATIKYPDWRGKDLIKESEYLDMRILPQSYDDLLSLPSIQIATDSGVRFVDSYTSEALTSSDINKDLKADTSRALLLKDYINKDAKDSWFHVRIPLKDFNMNYGSSVNVRNIILKKAITDEGNHCINIDQIEFIPINYNSSKVSTPSITAKGYERHADIAWNNKGLEGVKYVKIYRARDNDQFIPVGIQDPMVGHYSDYMGLDLGEYKYKISLLDYDYNETNSSNIATTSTYLMTDDELIDMVQRSAFNYFWDGAESNSGLALENYPGRRHMIAMGASGFGMMAIVAGAHQGYITREQAVKRFMKIASFLDGAEKFHGAFPHFMDGETGKVIPYFGDKDNGADFVETSFLCEGIIVARQYFDKDTQDEEYIRKTLTKVWEGIEWDKQMPNNSPYIIWHWSPDKGYIINHPLIGWNETMITYLMAIASPTHGVDKSAYYSGWSSQTKLAQDYRLGWGGTRDGSMYTNGNTYFGVPLKIGVSTGGPIFFTHFSYMGFDPRGIKDKFLINNGNNSDYDYFKNLKNIALINYRYCVENPKNNKGYGPEAWGLTASDGPWGYGACEPSLRGDLGTLSPAGAVASMPYLPKESIAAMKNYYRNWGSFLWGSYGFLDAFNLNENWCSGFYMGLSQGSIAVMLENYRSGYIWKLFMQDPDIENMRNSLFIMK